MARLVEPELAAAGEADRRQPAPALVRRLAGDVDALAAQFAHGRVEVVVGDTTIRIVARA